MSPKLARPLGRPIGLCVALTVPALVLRLGGVHPAAALSLAAFGTAVVAASFYNFAPPFVALLPLAINPRTPANWRTC